MTGIQAPGRAAISLGRRLQRRRPPTGSILLWVGFTGWQVFDRGAHDLAGSGPELTLSPPSGAQWVAVHFTTRQLPSER